MASALFTIDPATGSPGVAGVAQDMADDAGGVVVCAINDATGVQNIAWTIFGTNGVATPTITNASSRSMSFTVPAGEALSYGILCTVVDGAGVTVTAKSAVYSLDARRERQFFVGETFERDTTYATAPAINLQLNNGWQIAKVGKATVTGASGTTTVDSVLLPLDDAVYLLRVECAVFEPTTPHGGGYVITKVIRYASATATLVSQLEKQVGEEDATWDADFAFSGLTWQWRMTADATNDYRVQYTMSYMVVD